MKSRHPADSMVRTGLCGFLESRTATTPGRLRATSTQAPPLSPLREDLRHTAPVRSICPQLLSRSGLVGRSPHARDEAGPLVSADDQNGAVGLLGVADGDDAGEVAG